MTAVGGLDIRGICFLNCGLFPESHRPLFIQTLLLRPLLGRLIAKFIAEKKFKSGLASVYGKDSQPSESELDIHWRLMSLNGGHRLFNKLLFFIPERKVYRQRWVEESLLKSPVPIRLIVGMQDPVAGALMAARFKELIPVEPDIVELSNAGHYPQCEAVGDFIKEVDTFMGKVM